MHPWYVLILLYGICWAVIAYAFFLYPGLVRLLACFTPAPIRPRLSEPPPSMTLIVPVHNGRVFIERKIACALSAKYPPERLEICVIDDGSTDGTPEIARAHPGSGRIMFLQTAGHAGKNAALNQAVSATRGEIIVVSDIDAMPDEDALLSIAAWFADPAIGGVCGQKAIEDEQQAFIGVQSDYISYQQRIKLDESRIHSTTTNEGKLHAIRRSCFQPIADGVTDDLFNLLSVIKAGRRFIYEPSAIARIPRPSVSPLHELRRRRRIVHRSLRCMRIHGGIRNVPHTGWYRWMLLTQKVVRRLSSLLLAIVVLLHYALAFFHIVFVAVCLLQTLGMAAFLVRLKCPPRDTVTRFGRHFDKLFYFALGNLGTLLGLMDFIAGKEPPIKWTPQRASAQPPIKRIIDERKTFRNNPG